MKEIEKEEADVFDIWSEVMQEMSREGIETQLSKYELRAIVRARVRGNSAPDELEKKRESVPESLISKYLERKRSEKK